MNVCAMAENSNTSKGQKRGAARRRRPRRNGPVLVKLGLVTVSAAALGFSWFVQDAASASQVAGELIQASIEADTPERGERYRELAFEGLRASWSHPLDWNATAQEVAGWSFAVDQSMTGSPLSAALSYAWTEEGLTRAPINADGWVRLARYENVAGEEPLCGVRECLQHSWSSAPMGILSRQFGCQRIRLAIQTGLVTSTDDLYVRLFMYELQAHNLIDRCLAGLPEAELAEFRARYQQ